MRYTFPLMLCCFCFDSVLTLLLLMNLRLYALSVELLLVRVRIYILSIGSGSSSVNMVRGKTVIFFLFSELTWHLAISYSCLLILMELISDYLIFCRTLPLLCGMVNGLWGTISAWCLLLERNWSSLLCNLTVCWGLDLTESFLDDRNVSAITLWMLFLCATSLQWYFLFVDAWLCQFIISCFWCTC